MKFIIGKFCRNCKTKFERNLPKVKANISMKDLYFIIFKKSFDQNKENYLILFLVLIAEVYTSQYIQTLADIVTGMLRNA